MTKKEYCESKGLHIISTGIRLCATIPFEPNEEADEDFKELIDCLVDAFMKIFRGEKDETN